MHKVVLVANTAWYVYNFRRTLIEALQRKGYSVLAVAPYDEYAERVEETGARFHPLPMDNMGTNPFKDLRLAFALRRLLSKEHPCCTLTFTVKPNVFGAMAARSLGIPVIANVSGLGTAFIKRSWVTLVVRALYRSALRTAFRVFFQNSEDLQLFVEGGLVDSTKARLLPGSGVDTERFAPRSTASRRATPFRFLMLGRLLWDKGVGEYVEAATRVKRSYPASEFVLMGFAGSDNRTAIPLDRIREWERAGQVTYLAPATDVRDQLARAHCVVLPSYREGAPKSLLEASSMGLPIITTDVPGCRQVVEDGVTGYLARVRDANDLAEKMERMLCLTEGERLAMGRRGREKMQREFHESKVIDEYLRAVNDCSSIQARAVTSRT
jgi:glycosyltransferase involved in cell wall biosynthesis